jgi:hypothetical protein
MTFEKALLFVAIFVIACSVIAVLLNAAEAKWRKDDNGVMIGHPFEGDK